MKIFQKIGSLILGFAEDDALPWLKNLFNHVDHDVVTNILPEIEKALADASVAVLHDLSDGEKLGAALAAAGAALANAAPGILAKTESVTLQDVFAASAAVFSNITAAAKTATDAATKEPAT